jgi:hypothetical protein
VSSACFCGEVAMAPDSCVQFSVHTCQKCVVFELLMEKMEKSAEWTLLNWQVSWVAVNHFYA